MGLDMLPMGRPKPGKEEAFKDLFEKLQHFQEPKLGLLDRIRGRKVNKKAELLQLWLDAQISCFETMAVPMVGRDEQANEWARMQYARSKKEISEAEFLKRMNGHYVLDLIDDCDGIALYISNSYDRNVFRGQFLKDCADLIGEDLVGEAWETKFAEQALDYGQRLILAADLIAVKHNMEYLKVQREIPEEFDESNVETQLHIIYSMARWLIYYGERGHGYEADF